MLPRLDSWNSLCANSGHFNGYDMWHARYIYIVYDECKYRQAGGVSHTADAALHGQTMGCWYGIKWVSGSEAHTDRKHILFTHASCLYRFYLLSSALRCWVSVQHSRANKTAVHNGGREFKSSSWIHTLKREFLCFRLCNIKGYKKVKSKEGHKLSHTYRLLVNDSCFSIRGYLISTKFAFPWCCCGF